MSHWDIVQDILSDGKPRRAKELVGSGIQYAELTRWAKQGKLIQIERGIYGLQSLPLNEHISFLEASLQAPKGVICLLSALQYHELTTQLPHEVWMALPRNARSPKFRGVPVRIHHFSEPAFSEGIEKKETEGGSFYVYNLAKTIVDLFRLRNKVGLDVALEALSEGLKSGKAKRSDIHAYARKLRMYNVMRPYMEAIAAV